MLSFLPNPTLLHPSGPSCILDTIDYLLLLDTYSLCSLDCPLVDHSLLDCATRLPQIFHPNLNIPQGTIMDILYSLFTPSHQVTTSEPTRGFLNLFMQLIHRAHLFPVPSTTSPIAYYTFHIQCSLSISMSWPTENSLPIPPQCLSSNYPLSLKGTIIHPATQT